MTDVAPAGMAALATPRRMAHLLALAAALAAPVAPAHAGTDTDTDAVPADSLCTRPSTPQTCRNGVPVPITVRGTLESAVGFEDRAVIIRTKAGGVLSAWCKDKCEDAWFVAHGPGESLTLAPALRGRKVTLVVTQERNVGRIAGEEDDAEFIFIRRISLHK